MEYKKVTQKDIGSRARRIKDHAKGSLYGMNASSADCYAFRLDRKRETAGLSGVILDGTEWEGGWDQSRYLVDDIADYAYMLKDVPSKDLKAGSFYKIIK